MYHFFQKQKALEYCQKKPQNCEVRLSDAKIGEANEVTEQGGGTHVVDKIISILEDHELFPQANVKSKSELKQREREYTSDKIKILKIIESLLNLAQNSHLYENSVNEQLENFQFHHFDDKEIENNE